MKNFLVSYSQKNYQKIANISPEKALVDSIFGNDTLPYDADNWSKVTSIHCPHCCCELRIGTRALEELLCKDSDSFYGEFQEYCHECGGKVNFPVFSFNLPR